MIDIILPIEQPMTTELFAYRVLRSEGFADWEVKFSTGGSICLVKAKEIILDIDHQTIFDWRAREAVIHEIAHIRTSQDMKHSSLFFKEYASLILRHLANSEFNQGWRGIKK